MARNVQDVKRDSSHRELENIVEDNEDFTYGINLRRTVLIVKCLKLDYVLILFRFQIDVNNP